MVLRVPGYGGDAGDSGGSSEGPSSAAPTNALAHGWSPFPLRFGRFPPVGSPSCTPTGSQADAAAILINSGRSEPPVDRSFDPMIAKAAGDRFWVSTLDAGGSPPSSS